MAKHLERVEFTSAADCARRIAEAAVVAYYIARPGTQADVAFHYATMRRELDRLCEIMGLLLIDEVPAPPLDRVMTQSASAMIPEEML